MTKFVPILMMLLAAVPGASAATFNVTKTTDTADGTCDADCSLREAVIAANAAPGQDTISIPAGLYTLTLVGPGDDTSLTGDLDITDAVTLQGANAMSTIIDGNSPVSSPTSDRVFDVHGASATLAQLTVQHGYPSTNDDGGGIRTTGAATVTASSIVVRDNHALRNGGGLFVNSASSCQVSLSTFYDNIGDNFGGAIAAAGTLTLTNVTISGNSAVRGGGVECSGTCTVLNSTIFNNTAALNPGEGGGVRTSTAAGFLDLKNTIVAGNTAGTPNQNCFQSSTSVIQSSGNNIDSGVTCGFAAPGDQSSTDPSLGPLQDNGGATPTHGLQPGSLAIDRGNNSGCPTTDQRSVPRPLDGDGDTVAVCDVGSYEASAPLKIVKRALQSDGTPIPNLGTLSKGMPVKFMMYIDNPGGLVADVSMRDVLDPSFLYISGSIKYDNSVANCTLTDCTAAEEAAIFAAADSGTVGTDPVDGDVVSFTGLTLDIGNQSAANAQLDLAGGKVWAVVFTIRMQ